MFVLLVDKDVNFTKVILFLFVELNLNVRKSYTVHITLSVVCHTCLFTTYLDTNQY